MDSPWDEDPGQDTTRDIEWTKISTEFTNAGYREGITAGKESALQEGFDDGFAHVGAPIGRDLGILRGLSSAILSCLSSWPANAEHGITPEHEYMMIEARDIAAQLSNIRFTDIAPRDLEAEEHARQHLESEGLDMELNEELAEKRKMEGVEDMLAKLTAGKTGHGNKGRPTTEDARRLKERLEVLSVQLGLDVTGS